ncbi:MAG: efflux RND transporter permease subunit [Planctomycetales bacterium]|nr:efflux RND transporter permease subunit [Planctomycetales bacterium]
MSLVEAFVANPVKVTVGVLLVSLFGIISLFSMPMQLTPEVQTPTLTVMTRWPGGSPQEVEQEIVREQEEMLKSVEGITKLSSTSADSSGTITLEFAVGTNMEEALLKVNSRLQQVSAYPENADQPIITTSNSSNSPIAWFVLTPRSATPDEVRAFQKEHPSIAADFDTVLKASSPGLAVYRLRQAIKQHPVAAVLLPDGVAVDTLRRFAEDYIESAFERVKGVSNADVIGGLEDELQVVVDPEKLAARQLTIYDVRNVLRSQNRDTSGGDFWEGKRRWVVRTLNQFRSKEHVAQQLLAVRAGAPVYVSDVAEVRSGFKKSEGMVRRFGDASIAIRVLRENNANVLDVMEGLRVANDRLNQDILKPRGLSLSQVYDETEYIYSAIGLVRENIFLGGALTMVVLMLFLHLNRRTLVIAPLILATGVAAVYVSGWWFAVCLFLIAAAGLWYARGALVIGLAIPTSIVGTFLLLGLLGRSLNVISLAGLAFAVGMLVDNAIVVLENIYSRWEQGESPLDATVRGTQEVWGAIVASTLTTVAVFLPVIFVQEEAGQLFRDIALAISGAVGLSMIVAIVVIPPAAARILGTRRVERKDELAEPLTLSSQSRREGTETNKEAEAKAQVETGGTRVVGGMERGSRASRASGLVWLFEKLGYVFVGAVSGTNRFVQRNVFLRLATVAFFVSLCGGLSWWLWPSVEYLPSGNRNLVFAILVPPPGYNMDELTAMGVYVENQLKPYWDVDPGSDAAKKLNSPIIGDLFFVANAKSVFIGARALEPTRAGQLVPVLRAAAASIPGTFAVVSQTSLFGRGLESGRTIDIEITGPDLKRLVEFGGRILAGDPPDQPNSIIKPISVLIPNCQARPVPSLDLSSPEIHINPRLMQSAEMGMSAAELGYTVDALIDGAYAGDYFLGTDKIDLSIRGKDEFAKQTQDVASLPIATPAGQLVPLAALAEIEMSSGPEQVNHRERERAITIAVSPPPEIALDDALRRIQTQIVDPLIRSGQLDGGYRITLAGTADKLKQTWLALQFNLVLALLITYLLMAALYESWVYPFIIMFSVPLGAVGGLVGLKLLSAYLIWGGQPPQALDVLTMLGFVILIGTVVNNAILIVDQALQLIRLEGRSDKEAVIEAVDSRIRPMFMTTITTVLGLLPLVLFPGAGSELYRGLGAVVLAGLAASTVFNLFLIPTVFTLTRDVQRGLMRLVFGRGDA